MKIKKIAALCSQEGVFHLASKTDREGVVTQWLGDGGAFYPLLGAPVLDEAGLCTMFDITGKKRDSTIVRCDEMSKRLNVDDLDPKDIRLAPEELSINYHGATIIPLRGTAGTLYIEEKYLEPLDDERKLLELYSRTAHGKTYVVVKAGMMIRGIIGPHLVTQGLADKLDTIAWACKEELARQKQEQEQLQREMSWAGNFEETIEESEG